MCAGLRERTLPSGEGRLRIMVPWSEAEAFALMKSPIPSFHIQSDARGLVYDYAGGILRFHLMAADSLTVAKRDRNANITLALDPIRHYLQESCENCLSKIEPKISSVMLAHLDSLFDGTAVANDFKPLYDSGVLTRIDARMWGKEFVKPISKLALVMLYKALFPYKENRESLSNWEYALQHVKIFISTIFFSFELA